MLLPACADLTTWTPSTESACDGTDLVPDDVVACVADCATDTVSVRLVVEDGGAGTGALTVELLRWDGDGEVSLSTSDVGGEDGDGVSFDVSAADWGTGVLVARVTGDCGTNDLDLGPWPDPSYDADGDGLDAATCGGPDCDDADDGVHPGAADVPGDGVDQDCDGADAALTCDRDGDGADAPACGGDDCDDGDPDVHPGAAEIDADGVDQDCDGVELLERDPFVRGGLGCDTAGTAGASGWLALVFFFLLRAAWAALRALPLPMRRRR